MSRSAAVSLLVLLLSTPGFAAAPCTPGFRGADRLVGGFTSIEFAVYADFNGDGLTDIAADDGRRIGIFLNRGNGVFELAQTIGNMDPRSAPRAAYDVTGDGKPDLIGADADGIAVWRGNGDGTFVPTAISSNLPAFTTYTFIGVADLDGDGAKDVVFADTGTANAGIAFYRSAGDGTFTRGGGFAWPTSSVNVSKFALGDFDGDGRVDVARLDVDPSGYLQSYDIRLAYNQGGGAFLMDPSFTSVPASYNSSTQRIDAVDVDGDGVPAIVTLANPALAIVRARGRKVTTQTTTYDPFTGRSVVGIADLDEDGFPDLITSGIDDIVVFWGTATHGFSQPSTFYFRGMPAVADMNGDGLKDVVGGTDAIRAVYAQKGRDLPAPRMYAPRTDFQTTLVTDVTGDGVADLVVVDHDSRNFHVVAGLPGGGFSTSPSPSVALDGDSTGIVVVTGDFDGDGVTDVAEGFTAYSNGVGVPTIKIFFGNGTGNFVGAATLQISNAQLDGAGHFGSGDALVATTGGAAQIITAAHRTASASPATTIPSGATVFVADVDGDGRSDLLLAATDGLHIVKQISGAWQDTATVKMTTTGIRGVTAGDLNGDGRRDLVVNGSYGNVALIANSSGGFDVEVLPSVTGSGSVIVGDIDRSGKSSIILGGLEWVTILRRQAAGVYSPATVPMDTFNDSFTEGNTPIGVVDATGDGVPDVLLENGIVLAAGCAPPRLKIVAPSLVRPGDTATLFVEAVATDVFYGNLAFTLSENGRVIGTFALRWTSPPLTSGTHVFTLSSTDPNAGTVEQTVTILATTGGHAHAAKR